MSTDTSPQSSTDDSSTDVLIAGGGPNGLMLACELSLAGARPVVLERLTARAEENRANGLVGQVVRVLDHRGLHERLTGSAEPPRPVPGFVFGALPLDLSAVEDNPLHILGVPQRRVERALEERATELGAEIRRGHELTGLSQDAEGVTAEIAGPGGPYRLRARYLVGADGGRSLARKLCGIGFPGVTRDDTISRSAHVAIPESLIDPATGGLDVPGYGVVPPFMHHRTEHGLIAYAPFPGRPAILTTMEWGGSDRSEPPPMSLDELRKSVRRVLGVDLPFLPPEGEGPHLLRLLTGGNTRLADRYRAGRVLLVGDAAHVHSAIGGPGLNLGLQDTVNLGWKLAAVVRGQASEELLDTYESERRPAAERVVMHTQAQSALIAPGAETTALRVLFGELLRDPGNARHIAATMAGSDVRYDMGSADAHPLAGRFAPDLTIEVDGGAVRLAELARAARPLLLDFTGDAAAAKEASGRQDRVHIVTGRCSGSSHGVSALLVRPDGYVAWASSSPEPDEGELGTLRTALTRWFGSAT
ncbi:FAD-dependent monooxygenase [Nonomuraea roseoviolacea]|uniref:2-polyprenyl-6-methoxyphenol hydroxylase-like FAD-dependent oxidoreductase n=1 Tax=Nonomuraea roseoviolacea subsp. carminata TaxID=160689 RepID=A0ABT1JXJ0_9ACTN|nr:FAD-dependent monooxygenase [Nonomuraea roseoviolacea]MCP2346137.1 2-polyprenyl-6-methoxyphenol hydroxylase-like FAD-dependent oxidoreductase [Nonomuraea roseoviolacea subsp. carminata]